MLEAALVQLPHQVHARPDLVLALLKLGKRPEALREAGRAVSLQPLHPVTWVVQGMVQKDGGDYAGALPSTTRALQLDAGRALAHSNLGEILYAMQRSEEAKRHLQQAVTLASDVPDGHYWLAAIHADGGNTSQAGQELAESLDGLDQEDYPSNVTRQLSLRKLARLSRSG
ncbi:MAG TPA: hypothetical protein DCM14_01475 [Clostridiales bacterium UBA8153]|nr:hypothetical protein [Clostridiales bacterium UBA8153]